MHEHAASYMDEKALAEHSFRKDTMGGRSLQEFAEGDKYSS